MPSNMESEILGFFSSKSGRQKYTAWVPRDPTPSCFCNVMSPFEETNIFLEPNCYT